MYSKHFYDYCWHFDQNMIVLFLLILRFWSSNSGQWGKRKAIVLLKTIFHLLVCQSNWNAHRNISISQLLCYSCSSWQRLGVSACAHFEIFVVKVGSTCENKSDLDEKLIFHYKLSKKLSEAHRNISIFKILLYNTNSWPGTGCLCLCLFINFYPQKQLHIAYLYKSSVFWAQ